MLLVKTKIGPSKINGIGLFADQFIPEGAAVFKEDRFSITITDEELETLPDVQRSFVEHYAYKQSGTYKCSLDDDRFMNHSDDPNVDDTKYPDITVASRDIYPGEEITCDYRVIKMKYQPE